MKRGWSVWKLAVAVSYVGLAASCGPSQSSRGLKVEPKSAPPPPAQRSPKDSSSRSAPSVPARKSPQQVAALHRVAFAQTLVDQGEYRRAIADLEKTLTLDATNPLVYYNLARAHYGLSNFQESLDFLEVAESFMDERNVSRADFLVLKGDNLRGLGRTAEARGSYRRALTVDPDHKEAIARLRLL